MSFYYIKSGLPVIYNSDANILEAVFDISRYGHHKYTLKFEEPVNVMEAIERIETFLSETASLQYFEAIQDDLFPGTEFKDTKPRGSYLGDCIFLEHVIVKGHQLTIQCGS
jgi:hypothetical protein